MGVDEEGLAPAGATYGQQPSQAQARLLEELAHREACCRQRRETGPEARAWSVIIEHGRTAWSGAPAALAADPATVERLPGVCPPG